ncbi:MAG: hypothetical protein AAGG38_06380 [Planctomycetota bacterium]
MTNFQTKDLLAKLRQITAGVDLGNTDMRAAARQIETLMANEGAEPGEVVLWLFRRLMRAGDSPKE